MIEYADIVADLSWGDTGKGKVTSALVKDGEYDFVCRWAGGNNAGHTVFVDGKKYKNTPPLPKKKKTKSSASAKAKIYAKPGQVMPNFASLRRGGGPGQSMKSMQKRHADKLRKLRQELVTAFAKNDADYAALPPFEADSDGE